MTKTPEAFALLLYVALVPAMILAATVLAWVDKRFGEQKDPLRRAVVRLKYASLLAGIVMFVLLARLPAGIHIGSANATEDLEKNLDKMLQAIAIGLAVTSFWFTAAYRALKELSAAGVMNSHVPKATKGL